MSEYDEYYIVSKKALPDVLIKVAKANKLLENGKHKTVSAVLDQVGISRSAFYKYRDDISPLNVNARGATITIAMNLEDIPGLLSSVLDIIAKSGANILTINQNIPINSIANVTITIAIATQDTSFFEILEHLNGVVSFKIIAKENI